MTILDLLEAATTQMIKKWKFGILCHAAYIPGLS
jgi:hypothetical protein